MNGGGSCVTGEIDKQISIFDIISISNAICGPILLCVSSFLILVTNLWDIIICLCMCNGRTHHAKVVGFKSGCKMTNKHNIA